MAKVVTESWITQSNPQIPEPSAQVNSNNRPTFGEPFEFEVDEIAPNASRILKYSIEMDPILSSTVVKDNSSDDLLDLQLSLSNQSRSTRRIDQASTLTSGIDNDAIDLVEVEQVSDDIEMSPNGNPPMEENDEIDLIGVEQVAAGDNQDVDTPEHAYNVRFLFQKSTNSQQPNRQSKHSRRLVRLLKDALNVFFG